MEMYAALLILLSWLLQLPYDENRRFGDLALLQLHEWQSAVGRLHAWQEVRLHRLKIGLIPAVPDRDEVEKQVETLGATENALSSARTYLDSQGYHEVPLPALIVGLLDLKYDDSRRVGDFVYMHLHKWTLMQSHGYTAEGCKLEQMKRRPMGGSTDEDDILEQEKLVKRYYKAMKEAERGETILMMWGYRRQPPVPPQKPAPDRPK
jgi:hypothetical protein